MIRVKVEEPSSENDADQYPEGARVVRDDNTRFPWEIRVKTEPVRPAQEHRDVKQEKKGHGTARKKVKSESEDGMQYDAEKIRVKLENGELDDDDDVVEVIDLVRDPDRPPWHVKIEDVPHAKEKKADKVPTTVAAQAEEIVRKAVAAVQRARRIDTERKSAALARMAGGLADERPRPAWEEELDETPIPPLAKWETESEGRERDKPREERLVCVKNYAAVGVEYDDPGEQLSIASKVNSPGWIGNCYGLIDRGAKDGGGIRMLLMHTKEQGSTPHPRFGRPILHRLQPGMTLHVHSTAPGGGKGQIRVRFTTPARYYSPGERITTLSIGVDAADWQRLTPKRRRI